MKNKKKQRISFDLSECKFKHFLKFTRFNAPAKGVFVDPISDELDFFICENGRTYWTAHNPNLYDISKVTFLSSDVVCYSDSLHLRVRTKKALLRQLRHFKFPKGAIFLIDPMCFFKKSGDCDFKVMIKSNPIN